jgi:beta-mannanase
MYPGAGWVDIVGVDHYTKVPEFKEYDELKRLNKLIVNGEIGPHKDSYGRFDEMEVLKLMKGKAAYFLQWHSWNNAKVAIVDNLNYKELMNDPDAITLDKIK